MEGLQKNLKAEVFAAANSPLLDYQKYATQDKIMAILVIEELLKSSNIYMEK